MLGNRWMCLAGRHRNIWSDIVRSERLPCCGYSPVGWMKIFHVIVGGERKKGDSAIN